MLKPARLRLLTLTTLLIPLGGPAWAQSGGDQGDAALVYLTVAFTVALYLLPTIIGHNRDINSCGALFLVNFFFGWTLLVWIICLIWASSAATRAQDAFYKQNLSVDTVAYAKERARLDHEAAKRSS